MDTAYFKKKMSDRLKELDVRLHEIESDLDAPVPKDFEDQAIEREDDEVLEQLGNAGLEEIKNIKAALRRIEDGTYGTCANCQGEISTQRLETVPYTAVCRNCAI